MAYLALVLREEGQKGSEKVVWRREHPADISLCDDPTCPCKARRVIPTLEALFAGVEKGQWLTSAELARRAGNGWTSQALGPVLTQAGCTRARSGMERGWYPPPWLTPQTVEQATSTRKVSSRPQEGAAALTIWGAAK
jgi:hypothetical protein